MLKYIETSIFKLENGLFNKNGLDVFMKREDLNHPFVSGNKWWKLKYNLEEAQRLGTKTLLTFGGAFSNHIYSVAAAAQELGLNSIGVIRGERVVPLNPTLAFAEECGMDLHFVSRETYRKKNEPVFREELKEKFGDFNLVPEGGTNELAVEGCAEFARQKLSHIEFDHLCLPVGTGGTIAGVVNGLEGKKNVIGFSVLKGGEFLAEEVKKFIDVKSNRNWHIETNYHFGGYAKVTDELLLFINEFESDHNIPLDHVYTGKMMYGIFDLIRSGYFRRGSTILILHTGGLQGNRRIDR